MNVDKAIDIICFCYILYSLYRFLKELDLMVLDHEERIKKLDELVKRWAKDHAERLHKLERGEKK